MLAPLGVDLAMTTNGVKLPELAHDLAAAGLRRINVSLDSLRRDAFLALTQRDELDRVLAGIDAALAAGLAPVKVNAVVMRGVNDDEVVDLARFGRDKGVGVRFIEFMPLDAQGEWSDDKVVPAREILERIDAVFPLEPGDPDHVEPAERFVYRDGIGDVGVISSVTEPFCDNCDRVRITAEGQFRTCLFALDETDLRVVLRGGAWPRRTRSRRPPRGGDRGCRRHEVGRSPHRPGRLRPARPVDEPDRRLTARRTRPVVRRSRLRSPTLLAHASGVHPSRSARPGPHGRRHGQGTDPPAGRRPLPGAHGGRDRLGDRVGRDHQGRRARVARVAGIQAAKQTPHLLPLCHPLLVGSVLVNFRLEDTYVEVEAQVDTVDRTGVEMEALTAAGVAALTIYDMCKSIDRSMTIGDLALWEKTGGRSGTWRRQSDDTDEFGL